MSYQETNSLFFFFFESIRDFISKYGEMIGAVLMTFLLRIVSILKNAESKDGASYLDDRRAVYGENALAGVHTANNGGVVGAVARSCSAMPCLGHGPQRAVSAVFRVTVLHLVAFFCILRCLFARPVRGVFWGFISR